MKKNYGEPFEINHNPNWPYILEHPFRILIIGDSISGKTTFLLNKQQPDFNKIIYTSQDPFKSKNQSLINGRENVRNENLKNLKAFIDYSQTIHDVYENLENYNPTNKKRVLIVFDESNKEL